MSDTKDDNVASEVAALFQAFNKCSDGHYSHHVLEAGANYLIAAIHNHVRMQGGSREDALILARRYAEMLPYLVRNQWDHVPSSADEIVTLEGN